MPVIFKRQRINQGGQFLQIDRSNPLSRGLFCAPFYHQTSGIVYDAAQKNDLTAINGMVGATAQGLDFASPGKTIALQKGVTVAPVGVPLGAADKWSITVDFIPRSYVSLAAIFGFYGGSLPVSVGSKLGRGVLSYSNNYYFWGWSADWDTGISYDTDSKRHHFTFTCDGTNVYFYRDGVQRASASRPDFAAITTPYVYIGSGHDSAATGGDFIFKNGQLHNRCLSAEEVKSLHANPYQLLQSANDRIWIPSSGGITITSNPGSLTFTGNQSNVAVEINIASNAGALNFTGNQSTITIDTAITSNAGSLTFTGNQSTITTDTEITSNAGSLTFTGNQSVIDITTDISITSNAGSLVFTGNQSVISIVSSDIEITSNPGSLILTGNASTITANEAQDSKDTAGAYPPRKKPNVIYDVPPLFEKKADDLEQIVTDAFNPETGETISQPELVEQPNNNILLLLAAVA